MKEQQMHFEAFELAQSAKQHQQKLLYLCASDKEARLIMHELKLYLAADTIGYYPEREILPYDRFSTPQSILQDRIGLLNSNKTSLQVVVTSGLNLLEKLPPKEFFSARKVLTTGQKLSIKELAENLIALGYERTDKVEAINQFAIRGGVVDLYSSFYSTPLRIDFFGDEIDDIRCFDVDSQVMTEKLTSFQLFHGSEIALDEESIKQFKDNWRNYFQKHDERYCEIFKDIAASVLPEGYEIYMPLLQSKDTNLIDYFDGFKLLHSTNLDISIAKYQSYIKERYEEESIDALRPVMKPDDYFFTLQDLKPYLASSEHPNDRHSKHSLNLNLAIEEQINDLVAKHRSGELTTLLVTASEQLKLDELNKQHGFTPASLPLKETKGLFSALHHPTRVFLDKANSFAYINVEHYLGHDTFINKKVSSIQASLIHTFENPFHDDELVIHVDYGVGLYRGLTLLKTNANEEEFIQIEYLDKELLYVPIRQAYLVSKYQVSHVENIPLDSLSSLKWRQKKEKAEAKAKDHAAELLDIESRRSISTSPQLICPPDEYQKFSDDFPYIPTSDQQNCITDVIKDLALIKPMNRVICGDVGFGKTEIAMRAAFVCVQAKKQAMILAPSTVLSDQHHETFTKRFSNFPVNISILTRHTSPKARAQLYEDFKNKKIDILVGTHALLNNEIDLSSLGLLVIDEEHRFGTKQKEIIKSRQTTTHILYMSATPIPRTLNLVYSGLKDFSYLYTPPMERLSVKTFLNVHNNQIIKNAIDREVSRGGQVFIVQNDISKMDNLKNDIQALQPNVNIGIAHGRLSKQEISQTMGAFNSNSIDILLCTTIVEMGLDIPNANTIIVIDAQNFGLSQLHQLRGRVGRALRQSYCYLLIPTQDIKKNAKNKLDSLVRYSALGSGYFIAQEDLEIRGAGDFLGIKQSGHIEAIGLSMYLSMLKSAVNDLKGIKTEIAIDSEINFNDRALIPETFMPVANERLKVYRSLNDAKSTTEIHQIFEEIKDRCGKPSEDVLNLVENSKIRVLANNIGVRKIYSNKDTAMMTFHDSLDDEVYKKLIELIQSGSTGIKLTGTNKLNIDVSNQANKREAVSALLHQLS